MTDTAGSHNDGTVDRLLREAGFDDDAVLQAALEGLRGLAAEQPQASAAVAALMAPPVAGAAQPATVSSAAPIDELAARRRAKRRITLTTLSLAASLAAGGAVAVASDQGVRDSIGQLQHAVTSFVATVGGGPAPARPQTPAPAPAQPVTPAPLPAVAATTSPATAAGESGPGQAQHTPDPTRPSHVPLPDLPLPENVTPGIPGEPLNGEGPPTLPLPATPPVPVPSIHP
jgi:hypothetical protein